MKLHVAIMENLPGYHYLLVDIVIEKGEKADLFYPKLKEELLLLDLSFDLNQSHIGYHNKNWLRNSLTDIIEQQKRDDILNYVKLFHNQQVRKEKIKRLNDI